jgi:hypothetical protein
MGIKAKTPDEIRKEGVAVLSRELGPIEMVKFLQQYDMGEGDYTKERHKWLQKSTVKEIKKELKKIKK